MVNNTKNNMKAKVFWKSKTFWLSIIGIVIGLLQYGQGQMLAGSEVTIAGVLAIIMRSITTQPIKIS